MLTSLPFSSHAQPAAETAAISNGATGIKPTASGGIPQMAKVVDSKPGAPTKANAVPRAAFTPVCTGELAPTANVSLPEGKSGMLNLDQLKLPSPAWLRTIGDPEMVRVEPLTSLAPRNMFFLFGQKVGSTNLMFQDKSGRCAVVEVAVGIDTASVQASLAQLLPNEKKIRVATAANSLVLSGEVADAMAVDQVMAIANAYVRRGWRRRTGRWCGTGPAENASSTCCRWRHRSR